MRNSLSLLISGVTLILSTHAIAELTFEKAGFSIGTVHDEHAEFFDIENDGFLDAFTYNRNSSNIFNGKTKGYTASSQEAIRGQTYHNSKYISVADMNGDGLKDIISYPFRISLNDGNGHFPYPNKWHPWNHNGDHIIIQTTDLDNNGNIDLILSGSNRSNNSFQGDTQIFMNVRYDPTAPQNGYFSFESQTSYNQNVPPLAGHITNMKPNGVAVGDVNNDGMPDIIFINSSSGKSATANSSITLNNGSGGLIFSQNLSNAEDITLGDLDSDGDLDAYLARGKNQSDQVWLNDGLGVFTDSGQSLGTNSSTNAVMSDLDDDGDLDIVTTSLNTNHTQSHSIWLNDGTGHFIKSDFKFGFGHQTVNLNIIDIDQDGDQDIITLGGSNLYSSQGSIIISSNEVWLNQLYSASNADDYAAGQAEGIEYCKNNPEQFDLMQLMDIDQIILESFNEGILACQDAPNDFGLHTQNELISAEINGQQSCIDNPSSCQLFSEADTNEKYNEGYTFGEESGLTAGFNNGKLSCTDNPSSCELFNLNSVETKQDEAYIEGQVAGLSSGQQICIDDPQSCNLHSRSDLDSKYTEGFAAGESIGIINGFSRGTATCINNPESCDLFDQASIDSAKEGGLSTGFNNGQQSCIENPESCNLFNQDSIESALDEGLSNGFDNGQQSCAENPESCNLLNTQMQELALSETLKQIANDLPRGHLKSLCKKKPNNLLCEFKQHKHPKHPKHPKHKTPWLSKVLHHFVKQTKHKQSHHGIFGKALFGHPPLKAHKSAHAHKPYQPSGSFSWYP
jgi:hypothetical protein